MKEFVPFVDRITIVSTARKIAGVRLSNFQSIFWKCSQRIKGEKRAYVNHA